MNWPTYPKISDLNAYFGRWELECRCGCGRVNILPDALSRLFASRNKYGNKMLISAGSRCEQHNREVGGAPQSSHLDVPEKGLLCSAFDIVCSDPVKRHELIRSLVEFFPRIFVYNRHVHVDADPKKAWPIFGLGVYKFGSNS